MILYHYIFVCVCVCVCKFLKILVSDKTIHKDVHKNTRFIYKIHLDTFLISLLIKTLKVLGLEIALTFWLGRRGLAGMTDISPAPPSSPLWCYTHTGRRTCAGSFRWPFAASAPSRCHRLFCYSTETAKKKNGNQWSTSVEQRQNRQSLHSKWTITSSNFIPHLLSI